MVWPERRSPPSAAHLRLLQRGKSSKSSRLWAALFPCLQSWAETKKTNRIAVLHGLIATGRNELPTHAALFDPVAFHNTLHRSSIVPRGQSGHHAFPHRSLQFSVLLQLTVTLQFHFLALARSYPRSFQRDLLSTEDHVTRLLSPAHTARCGIWPMWRSYSVRDFVFQDGA